MLACASKTTKLHATMYLSNIYMCRDYLQYQKQTICVITTCVCTIRTCVYTTVCEYQNYTDQCTMFKYQRKLYIASRAVCEFYTMHNIMFNKPCSTIQQLVACWRILRPCKYTVYSSVVRVPNQRASIMCTQLSTLS